MNKYFLSLTIFFLLSVHIPAQEILKSAEEEYYDFFVLNGATQRPAINYRTLSDSVWSFDEDESHPWQNNNLGIWRNLSGNFRLRIYGPDLFLSGNTHAPFGQNDGVLWQGRGFNALLKTGVRLEGYGIEFTILPHFAFSQNAEFGIMPSVYGNEYGYYWGYGVDAPQRFGGESFFDWDPGDSEIRYTWKSLTAGFGTQTVWLGPSSLTPILHSNNAPSYPKFDIGLRRQRVTIPGLKWYIGDIETRIWIGRLCESDYFDDDDSNNYNMFHGFSFAYAPSFLPGLTIFANRVCIVPWEWKNIKYVIPSGNNTIEDQKMSIGYSWFFSEAGFEIYGEMGVDDYVIGGATAYLRHPFHTNVYTGGIKKMLEIKPQRKIYGELKLEYSWMEMTQDFQLQWPYSVYFHHQITQGYTNRGQWLGNGVSPGGNSQLLSFTLYYPKGNSQLFFNRNNPDSNFIYSQAVNASAENYQLGSIYYRRNRANFNVGLNTGYFLNTYVFLSGGVVYNYIINPNYFYDDSVVHNFSFQFNVKINI
ncbi:MAG: capsule assembly Wzi family protein [Treponema sp.]|nr:capsule assembly Wzi family protein [Treponema sp.]